MAKQRSAAERSAIVGAAGMMSAVWLALQAAVRQLGGKDEDLYRLNTPEGQTIIDKMAELVVGTVLAPLTQVAWNLVLNWIIGACRFVTYMHPDITAEHFPLQLRDLTIKEVIDVAIPRSMSTPDVLKFLDEKGLRPATLVELLWWWLTNPAKQSNCLVVALGSVWDGRAPCVCGGGVDRYLDLLALALDWSANCTFAAVRK